MEPIPYARQNITDEDIEAVAEALRSDFLTQGPRIDEFERAIADRCGAKYAVAVSSGTAGLVLACEVAGLGAGDRLWTTPNTFVASANCGRYCGADVDFVDIDSRSYNLSVAGLEEKLKDVQEAGTLPKVVVPVHFAGQSCEMETIRVLAKKFGFTVIEDASHAVGGGYQDLPIGGCRFSEMVVFSFHPVKILTTGEGGMVLTNDKKHYERLLRLRHHGITRGPDAMEREVDGPWYYEQQELGLNCRITDLQCALGSSQFKRLDAFVGRRRELAARYDEALAGLPLTLPWQHPDTASSWHLYVVRLQLGRISKGHREVFEELRVAGILVNLHYIPVHLQPYYRHLGFSEGMFPEAERYYGEAISLPMYFDLSERDQDRVIDTLKAILT